MASFAATSAPAAVVAAIPRRSFSVSFSPVLGFPVIAMKGRVRCSVDGKQQPSAPEGSGLMGMSASIVAAICAATMSGSATALVDERLSTEGTGLPFGLSNNLLGWIIFGVFGLIWSFYFIYTSNLEEDEDSGLSL